MYPPDTSVAVSIGARGLHVAPYDRVAFRVSLRDRGSTGDKARAGIADPARRLAAIVDGWERAGVAHRVLAVTRVGHAYSAKGGADGYEAVHDCVVRSTDVGRVTAMQSELMAVPKAIVQSPQFEFQDPEPHRQAALTDAWARVRRRLDFECGLLGVPRESLTIHSWQADYDDRQHAVQKVAASRAMDDGDMPGMAQVAVTLTVRYRFRAGGME